MSLETKNLDIVAAILAAPYLGPTGRNTPEAAVAMFLEIRNQLVEKDRERAAQSINFRK